jgi:putative addiction module component (TIGR02574 family)
MIMSGMSISQHQFLETALSLPATDRADLAFRLLQSLDKPGEEISAEEFGAELHRRFEGYRSGTIKAVDLQEARAEIEEHLAKRRGQ